MSLLAAHFLILVAQNCLAGVADDNWLLSKLKSPAEKCKDLKAQLSKNVLEIVKDLDGHQMDFRANLERYDEVQKDCPFAQSSENQNVLSAIAIIRKKYESNRIEDLRQAIEIASKYRNVDAEVALYARETLGKPAKNISIINEFRAKYLARGRESAKRERKSCAPDRDFSKQLGPARDQGRLGWCGAYCAADLLSFKLKQKISAVDVAVSYYRGIPSVWEKNILNKKESDLQGMQPDVAISRAVTEGLCLDSKLPSEVAVSDVKDLLDRLEATQKPGGTCETFQTVGQLFPQVDFKSFSNVLKSYPRRKLVEAMADEACRPRLKIPNIRPISKQVSRLSTTPDELFESIDKQLDRDNISCISYDPGSMGMTQPNSWVRATTPTHASAIVGRRFNEETGGCEYLVRNSYSSSCDQYDQKLKCESGNIWVPKERLEPGLSESVYLP